MDFRLNYPIETDEAYKFWSSKHRLNRIKAIMAFSLDLGNANDNLRRRGYSRCYRKRFLIHYESIINNPKMDNIPFSDGSDVWWNPQPIITIPADSLSGKGLVKNSDTDYALTIKSEDVNTWIIITSTFNKAVKSVYPRRPANIAAQKNSDTELQVKANVYNSVESIIIQMDDNSVINIHVTIEAQT